MPLLDMIKRRIRLFVQGKKELRPAAAYDLWASTYDDQPGNLLMYLDELVFTAMIESINLQNKVIADIGCGTGRHWQKLLSKDPSKLIGYDVSEEMLGMLHQKFPQAQTYILKDNLLSDLEDNSCDIIICNLVIGYIKNLKTAFAEWNRVLKSNGMILITDFHPAALQKGAERSFTYSKKTVLIKNHLHTLQKIKALASELHWEEKAFLEKKVDESIKFFYAQQNALHIYEESFNTPLLYGWLFTLPAQKRIRLSYSK
jgi:ubiquinone/menaquinone biosynthesis C-methylase UbiE